jgi:hypothetical protein
VRLKPENGDHEELVLSGEDVRIQGCVVYVVHPPKKKAAGVGPGGGPAADPGVGSSFVPRVRCCRGSRRILLRQRRTEHEVGYQHRVEVVERIQLLVICCPGLRPRSTADYRRAAGNSRALASVSHLGEPVSEKDA